MEIQEDHFLNLTQQSYNGYFHKHNLYRTDNKIADVREQTIFLYFLLLGGISFKENEKYLLGGYDDEEKKELIDEENDYRRFKLWFDNTLKYDIPEVTPGLWCLLTLTGDEKNWELHSYLMKHFYIDDFEDGSMDFGKTVVTGHTCDIPVFSWKAISDNRVDASFYFQRLFDRYYDEASGNLSRINAVIIGYGKLTQLIYFKQ